MIKKNSWNDREICANCLREQFQFNLLSTNVIRLSRPFVDLSSNRREKKEAAFWRVRGNHAQSPGVTASKAVRTGGAGEQPHECLLGEDTAHHHMPR